MNLHIHQKQFADLLRLASQFLQIKQEFIEKDYWITLVLYQLARSKYTHHVVFKGGTSLSKGYNLIDRFSEDIDLALLNQTWASSNQIKTIIRNIEKEISIDLNSIHVDGLTSKGSRFRKSVFEYTPIEKNNLNNTLILEINSFANPIPYHRIGIQTLLCRFLINSGFESTIQQYNLQSFEINILALEQTLLEKLVALYRFSFYENTTERLSEKIRHFYDIYYLMQHELCIAFIQSPSFRDEFNLLLEHDKLVFDEPNGWSRMQFEDSPLTIDFDKVWKQLKRKYQTELTALAYKPIPDEQAVYRCVNQIIIKLKAMC
ncbi:MAG: nucleotidyl transferase AbiEii/AbiGii toxin family protein [Chitinophagaceae bacterium]